VKAVLGMALAALLPGTPLLAQAQGGQPEEPTAQAESEPEESPVAEAAEASALDDSAKISEQVEKILAALRVLDESPPVKPGTPAAAPPPAAPTRLIVLVSASPEVLARQAAGPLDPDAPFCLAARENALLASDRVSFFLIGEECISPTAAEFYAFKQELAVVNDQNLSEAIDANYAAQQGGDQAEIDRAAARLKEAAKQAPATIARLRKDEGFWVSGRAGVYYFRNLDDPDPRRPRTIIFRVASGSAAVLVRFPRGTVVQQSMALCLNEGEQLTITANIGQSATYSGPGCLRRQGKPTPDNIGAFTFG